MPLDFILFNYCTMEHTHLQGLISAPFTPMHSDGSVNLTLIPAYYAMLKANGVTGAFICGSTGEGVSLTKDEKMAVAEAWAACTKMIINFLQCRYWVELVLQMQKNWHYMHSQ